MQRTIDQLLRQPEGRTLEFKRAEADPGKVVKSICAFANTAGGHVVIGVGDDREVRDSPPTESPIAVPHPIWKGTPDTKAAHSGSPLL